MSVADRRRQDVESNLTSLNLSSSAKAKKRAVPQHTPDSWEDAAMSGSDTETEMGDTPSRPQNDMPSAPPPTPITPSSHTAFDNPYTPAGHARGSSGEPMTPLRGNFRPGSSDERPEKSTATASRLIAGALGVRRPKETEETRAYEKAVRDREGKRLEREREERARTERDGEEARRRVWED